ncbi:EutN/CcmL family microcompartment protein [Paenibacillus larvae]|uniref:EutN/CcmL family microcompartment protein n=1 Tax=Paenibacillus larvae TaxID=1464 RepID=UPI00024816CC|nr:EutN/CcmL family microcompartment protein [Paenibacillus larvae]MDT2294181.1 EutN/CcmL family microcompartment protein [Paenibacillus larvae]
MANANALGMVETKGLVGAIEAADNAGAGIGDTVLVTKGSSARTSIANPDVPVDAVIVGIVDSIELAHE